MVLNDYDGHQEEFEAVKQALKGKMDSSSFSRALPV
ncbi:Uncharacterised protein [Klebsiella pneumoniae]|jgi:hypothetical protein|nr:Uncharacterised protein [Klebsiella pneumoniae]VDA75622.1 hypothetical protein BANRA_05348 [Klebsiella quasipneumoniae]VGE56707.1 Uncharacterised protein [Klebsiella pneumoniae]